MKNVSIAFAVVIALRAFDGVVTALPMTEPFAMDKGSVTYDGLINALDISNDDDEPIKRDQYAFPQMQESNDKRQALSSPNSNNVKPSTSPSQLSTSTSHSDTNSIDNEQRPVDDLPVAKKSEDGKAKRKIPGINPINYFGNEEAEEQSDGSDDLFSGGSGSKCFAFQTSFFFCFTTRSGY